MAESQVLDTLGALLAVEALAAKARLSILLYLLKDEDRPEPRLSALETGAVRSLVATQDDLGYQKYVRFNRAVFYEIDKRFSAVFDLGKFVHHLVESSPLQKHSSSCYACLPGILL